MSTKTAGLTLHDRLVDEHFKQLDGAKHGVLITLNTNWHVTSYTDPKLRHYFGEFERIITLIQSRLNRYCYGRSSKRDASPSKLKFIDQREVGRGTGIVHVHMLAMHDGDVLRTKEQIEQFLRKQWSEIFGTTESSSQVNVKKIYTAKRALRYITKDVILKQRYLGEVG